MIARVQQAATLLALLSGLWQTAQGLYIPAKAVVAQQLLQLAWERTQAGARVARPWPWADTHPVARLTVPELDIDQIVLEGASGRTLAFGPGLLPGSVPAGDAGHIVISGHRDTHFRFLAELAPGARIYLTGADGARHAYRVDDTQVVDMRQYRGLTECDGRCLTLVTCYPFDAVVPGGPLRFLVFAREESNADAT
ncbi:MAG: class GN sortase [Gammaproteobacteria bacterium]|nr:class GN sortase [Gammaproteobacteria bacterium]